MLSRFYPKHYLVWNMPDYAGNPFFLPKRMEKGQTQEQSDCSYSNYPSRKDFAADIIPTNYPIDNIADHNAEEWHDRYKIAHYWNTYFPHGKIYATK